MDSPQRPMPTEAGILQFMEICDSFYPPDAVTASIGQQRQWYDALCARFDRPLPDGMRMRDELVSGTIPIRRYLPADIRTATCLLYLHGGGFVVGSLESHHAICAGSNQLCFCLFLSCSSHDVDVRIQIARGQDYINIVSVVW